MKQQNIDRSQFISL